MVRKMGEATNVGVDAVSPNSEVQNHDVKSGEDNAGMQSDGKMVSYGSHLVAWSVCAFHAEPNGDGDIADRVVATTRESLRKSL